MGGVQLSPMLLKLLIDALRVNASIVKLDLSFCRLGDHKASQVIHAISGNANSCIQNLILVHVGVGLEGVQALIRLVSHSILEELDIRSNPDITTEMIGLLQEAAYMTRTLRVLRVAYSDNLLMKRGNNCATQ